MTDTSNEYKNGFEDGMQYLKSIVQRVLRHYMSNNDRVAQIAKLLDGVEAPRRTRQHMDEWQQGLVSHEGEHDE